jgi:hypothetical protein
LFGRDERVVAWDIYNEVTNTFLVPQGLAREERDAALYAAAKRREATMDAHLRLLDLAFGWARAAQPEQPLTSGVWFPDRALNERIIAQSDVVTFHNYEDATRLARHIERLRRYERPLICTEWMARHQNSRFETHLPIFLDENVGCYCWGLVNGKTQTHLSWTHRPGAPEDLWFHDVLHSDGTPYDSAEVATIRDIAGAARISS